MLSDYDEKINVVARSAATTIRSRSKINDPMPFIIAMELERSMGGYGDIEPEAREGMVESVISKLRILHITGR